MVDLKPVSGTLDALKGTWPSQDTVHSRSHPLSPPASMLIWESGTVSIHDTILSIILILKLNLLFAVDPVTPFVYKRYTR